MWAEENITVAVDDPDLASMRIGHGWVCEIVDVGSIPFEVTALCRWLEKYKKPQES